MVRHVQSISASGHEHDRCLAMQEAADRGRHVLVDRVMHELVPEHDAFVSLVQELSIERGTELPDHLGRRPAGDSGDVAKRNGIAQNSRDLQQFQRCRGQVAKPPNHEVTQRGRQLRGRHVDDVPGAAQQSFIGQ